MPRDLEIEVDRLTREEAMALAAYLAAVVGRTHPRCRADDRRTVLSEFMLKRSNLLRRLTPAAPRLRSSSSGCRHGRPCASLLESNIVPKADFN